MEVKRKGYDSSLAKVDHDASTTQRERCFKETGVESGVAVPFQRVLVFVEL